MQSLDCYFSPTDFQKEVSELFGIDDTIVVLVVAEHVGGNILELSLVSLNEGFEGFNDLGLLEDAIVVGVELLDKLKSLGTDFEGQREAGVIGLGTHYSEGSGRLYHLN